MLAFLHRWHRRLALGIALVLLGWLLSGLLHPLLSRLSVPPKQPAPQLAPFDVHSVLPARTVLKAAGVEQFHLLQLVGVDGRAIYLVQVDAGALPRFFAADSGAELADFGARWATALAKDYLGRADLAVRSVEPMLAFSETYPVINRYLPAWQIRFEGAEEFVVWVDAVSGRPAAIEHRLQRQLRQWFQWLHTFSFLPDRTPTLLLQLLLITAVLALALAGLLLWWQQRQRPASSRLRAWHRHGGMLLSVFLLMFAASGLLHVLAKLAATPMPVANNARHGSSELSAHWPHGMADGAATVWLRWQPGDISQWLGAAPAMTPAASAMPSSAMPSSAHREHDHEASRVPQQATGGWRAADGTALAPVLALAPLAQAVGCEASGPAMPITRFGDDYGFLNKRLPVWQLDCASGARLFVDASDDTLAARILTSDRFESWSFRYLHKWRFLDALGRDGRDALQALVVFALVLLTVLGVSIWGLRMRRRLRA